MSCTVQSIIDKHTQWADLLQATPAEVRAFVLKRPTHLHLDPTSTANALRIQLWVDEAGRPLHSIVEVPHLFQLSLGRIAARIASSKSTTEFCRHQLASFGGPLPHSAAGFVCQRRITWSGGNIGCRLPRAGTMVCLYHRIVDVFSLLATILFDPSCCLNVSIN